jgi:hypothetical protein
MPSAIQSIVDAYVKVKNIDALNRLKEHRKRLIRDLRDREHFDFKATRQRSEDDLAVIEQGIQTLTDAINERSGL